MITVQMPARQCGKTSLAESLLRDWNTVSTAEKFARFNSYKLESLAVTPGMHFAGITATGRRIPCTVAEDGTYSADTHEVTRLVGWLPI